MAIKQKYNVYSYSSGIIGTTEAVSEADAVNNVSYRMTGFGMGTDGDLYAVPVIPKGTVMDCIRQVPFDMAVMKDCPHPAVIEKYGYGGKAAVSIYSCKSTNGKRCRFCIQYPNTGAVGCSYGGGA